MKAIKTKNYVMFLVYLLIIIVLFIFGILPYFNKLSANQSEYSQTKDALDLTLKKYTQLTELAKNEQEIKSTKEEVYKLLPDSEDTSDFVVKLEALAKDLSIPDYISSISTSQTTATTTKVSSQQKKQKDKKEISYSIGFSSNYSTIESFLDKLYDFPRFNTIKDINISGYNSDQDTLNFRTNGTLYYGK